MSFASGLGFLTNLPIGPSRGTLSRLFQGKAPLKLSHITGICRVADLDPGEFFRLVYLRPSSSLLSTDPQTPSDPSLPKHLAVLGDFFEPHPLNRLLRASREEQEEVRELFRVICSSMATARWVLWWLEDETRLRSLRSALRTSIGMGGGGFDPNG
jgi:hypothetical protein